MSGELDRVRVGPWERETPAGWDDPMSGDMVRLFMDDKYGDGHECVSVDGGPAPLGRPWCIRGVDGVVMHKGATLSMDDSQCVVDRHLREMGAILFSEWPASEVTT